MGSPLVLSPSVPFIALGGASENKLCYQMSMLRDFLTHAKTPLIALAINIVGNWLSNILWEQLGLAISPITKVFVPITMSSIIMYALYKTAKKRLNELPDMPPAVYEGNKHLISQGAIFSLVTALYAWCGEEFSTEKVSALLASLVPYVEGIVGAKVISSKLKNLYETAHYILEKYSKTYRQIRQKWVVEELKTYSVGKDLDEAARWSFVGYKMKLWAGERNDVIIKGSEGKLIAEIIRNG